MIIISATDLMRPEWRFLADASDDPSLVWRTHSGLPRNTLERLIRRPSLGRWRAALEAALDARRNRDALLVSHLPLMAAATNLFRRLLCPRIRHIAFAFNFTDLPTGWRRRFLSWAFRGIDEFVVFSRFERERYAAHFGIPIDKLHFIPWVMDAPVPGSVNPARDLKPYLCAVGGEGRDYPLLVEAMQDLPHLRLVIVARPHSLAGVTVPANVMLLTNRPVQETWTIAAESEGMVLPLKTDTTACGHITLVGAQLLGLPLAITRSRGVADYVEDGETALSMEPGDKMGVIRAITS
ncbi:MAG: hypothetical protein ACOVOI_07765, partial [Hyphomicrobiales bacterium]